MPPVPAARSVSARVRSLPWAVKIRRCRRAVSSDEAEAGAVTVGLRPPFVAAPASALIGACVMGLSKMILRHPQGLTSGGTMSRHHWHGGDGDGFCEVHVNTMEDFWSLLRSWLRPHRGQHIGALPS